MHAASAASVAAELLAFHREPVLHRPRYLHGQQPLPSGHVVLRLALGRFPHGWARDLSRAERDEVRLAAQEFVRQVCLWERATHYQLLCVAAGASRDEIRENYQLLIALIHPDRQEPGAPSWPTGCAQRANQAYATLSEPRAREEYDAGLRSPAEAFEGRPRETPHVARHRHVRAAPSVASLAKRASLVAAVIATLFVVQSWWVSGLRPEHSLIERVMPNSARWGGTGADSPRFIGPPAIETPPPLEPLKEPKRLTALAAWVPIPAQAHAAPVEAGRPLTLAAASALSAASPIPAAPIAPAARPAAVASPPALPAPPVPVARAPEAPAPAAPATRAAEAPAAASRGARVAPTAEPPVRLAQAGAAPNALPETPTRDQVEGVVALVVGFYDSGDSERLLGLVDSDALGWWQGYRMRASYADFFGATSSRRLRVERLAWRTNGTVAEARGEATVVAEYADGRPRLERRVPVEMDIALRAGAPRITRLVLYPGA